MFLNVLNFPRGCTYPFDIRYIFAILCDLIESLEDTNDYIRCLIILNAIYNNTPKSLNDFCLSDLMFIQYVFSTYETANLSEEIKTGFNEIQLVMLRDKLQNYIEAEQSL